MVFRYPEEKLIHNKHVGMARVNNLAMTFIEFGFYVEWYKPEHKGVDMKVYDGVKLFLVVEVTNWRKYCYLNSERQRSIIDNLNFYRCHKLFVCSFEENYKDYEHCFSDITILSIGFQTNPHYYYFKENGVDVSDKRPNTVDTYLIERAKIYAYLRSIGMLDDYDYSNTISMIHNS